MTSNAFSHTSRELGADSNPSPRVHLHTAIESRGPRLPTALRADLLSILPGMFLRQNHPLCKRATRFSRDSETRVRGLTAGWVSTDMENVVRFVMAEPCRRGCALMAESAIIRPGLSQQRSPMCYVLRGFVAAPVVIILRLEIAPGSAVVVARCWWKYMVIPR